MSVREIEYQDANLHRVALDVLCGDIVVLKRAVNPSLVRSAVSELNHWAEIEPQSKKHPRDCGGASHLISYLPARSESRYIAHDFLIQPLYNAPIVSRVMPVFDVLRDIYNGLLGEKFDFGQDYDGFSFLPQVIQYPRGGGFFQEHFHPINPQKIGLVLAGSEYGSDFTIGGGRFRSHDGTWVSTEGSHQIGDVSLFRFDIGHDITPIDPEYPLDWSKTDGRWSFVLPLKRSG